MVTKCEHTKLCDDPCPDKACNNTAVEDELGCCSMPFMSCSEGGADVTTDAVLRPVSIISIVGENVIV